MYYQKQNMKKLTILSLIVFTLFSCQKENLQKPEQHVTLKSVTVDFRQIPDMSPVVTFKGASGQGDFTFNITDGQLQTKQLPAAGNYSIGYSFLDCDPGCTMTVEAGTKNYQIHSNYSVSDTLDGSYMLIMICGMPSGG